MSEDLSNPSDSISGWARCVREKADQEAAAAVQSPPSLATDGQFALSSRIEPTSIPFHAWNYAPTTALFPVSSAVATSAFSPLASSAICPSELDSAARSGKHYDIDRTNNDGLHHPKSLFSWNRSVAVGDARTAPSVSPPPTHTPASNFDYSSRPPPSISAPPQSAASPPDEFSSSSQSLRSNNKPVVVLPSVIPERSLCEHEPLCSCAVSACSPLLTFPSTEGLLSQSQLNSAEIDEQVKEEVDRVVHALDGVVLPSDGPLLDEKTSIQGMKVLQCNFPRRFAVWAGRQLSLHVGQQPITHVILLCIPARRLLKTLVETEEAARRIKEEERQNRIVSSDRCTDR